MSRKDKGRAPSHGDATPRTAYDRNSAESDPLAGWFSLAKASRIKRQQKRGWQRGR